VKREEHVRGFSSRPVIKLVFLSNCKRSGLNKGDNEDRLEVELETILPMVKLLSHPC